MAARRILGIETSCDETAAAVVDEDLTVRSSVVVSSIALHERFGGVVPELAGRAQVDAVGAGHRGGAVATRASTRAVPACDAVAVTCGPGLVGSLLVGVSAAKAMALAWGVPLVGVNHLEGHLVAARLEHGALELPVVTLLVSGGHTLLVAERVAGRLRAARGDDRRRGGGGVRQGRAVPRARLPGRPGDRPSRRRRRPERLRLPPAAARRRLRREPLGAEDRRRARRRRRTDERRRRRRGELPGRRRRRARRQVRARRRRGGRTHARARRRRRGEPRAAPRASRRSRGASASAARCPRSSTAPTTRR